MNGKLVPMKPVVIRMVVSTAVHSVRRRCQNPGLARSVFKDSSMFFPLGLSVRAYSNCARLLPSKTQQD